MEIFTNESVSTAFLTLAVGILLYLSSECYNTIIKEPYQKYTNLRSEIAYAIIYYANIYENPNVKVSEEMRSCISEQFRGLAAKYVATMENMSLIGWRQLINEIPNDNDG